MFEFLRSEEERILLESLSKDDWLVTRGDGACKDHFYVRRNGIELCLSLAPSFGWLFFKATVNGHNIKKYSSVKNKCVKLIQSKFGAIDTLALIKRELGIINDLSSS
jgi:hypothetical protein